VFLWQKQEGTKMENIVTFWKSLSEGFDKTLPSGAVVKIKLFPLEDYIARGRIPNALQSTALAVFMSGGFGDQEDLENDIKFVDYVVAKSLVQPGAQLARKDVQEGEIFIKDIPWPDRLQIYLAAIKPEKVRLDFLSKPAATE